MISSLLAGRLLGHQIQRALGRGRRRWSSQLVIACEFVWNATQLTVVKSTFLAECSQNQVTAQLLGFCTDRADFQKKRFVDLASELFGSGKALSYRARWPKWWQR